jgi:phosphoribosylanthranilate isomerase
MMPPYLKICGIRQLSTAAMITKYNIDYIGFVFAPSKRQVSPLEAQLITSQMKLESTKQRFVGVFVNPSVEHLIEITDSIPLDVVQLHGQEPASLIREFKSKRMNIQVWKAIGLIDQQEDTPEIINAKLSPYLGLIDALLLDAYDPLVGGGTGRAFQWERIPAYADWLRKNGILLFIAGGLHPHNISSLLSAYGPEIDGIDVSSGVETDGMKDLDKIRIFTERVKFQ